MKALYIYLQLRLKQLSRLLKGVGVFRSLLLLGAFALALYSLVKMDNRWAIPIVIISGLLFYHNERKDKEFLSSQMICPIFLFRMEYTLIGLPFAVIESLRSYFLEAIIIMTVCILLPKMKTIKWKLCAIPLPFLYKGGIEYLRMFRLYGWLYMLLIIALFMGAINDNIRVGKVSMIAWGIIQASAFTSIPHAYEHTFFLNHSTFQKYLVCSNAWNVIVTCIPLMGCMLVFSFTWETLRFSACVMIGSILYLWNIGMIRFVSSSIMRITLYQLVLLIPLFIYACFIPYLLILFVLINGWLYILVKNKLNKVWN